MTKVWTNGDGDVKDYDLESPGLPGFSLTENSKILNKSRKKELDDISERRESARGSKLLITPPVPFEQKEQGEDDDIKDQPMATLGEVFSFGRNKRVRACLVFGIFFSAVAGAVYPGAAFATANMFQTLAAPTGNEDYLNQVTIGAYIFMVLGAWSFVFMSLSSFLLETAASEMAFEFSSSWFAALLRQDMAYHDLMKVTGVASTIASSSAKYRRGIGRKLGEGVIYLVALLGGFGYAFWASWQTSLVVLGVLPFMALTSMAYIRISKEQASFSDKNYAEAGSIVYTTVLCIRTVLSLNAVESMIDKFTEATERACKAASDRGWKVGLANGSMMGSFQLSYMILTLFGSFLVYEAVRDTGCDPSASVPGSEPCDPTGNNVFGAFIGMSMAGMGVPFISASLELLTKARVAIHPAMCAINRKVGEEEMKPTSQNRAAMANGTDEETGNGPVPLPKYAIDSSSPHGLKPLEIKGDIEFKNVEFSYPARRNKKVLTDFSLKIEAGKTVALVGPSGGGKSTIVSLLERFYDPNSGAVTVDGINIKDFNVRYLRESIGLVQQEPMLFATTVAENLRYGKLSAQQGDIEAAAKLANAHEFISAFPGKYETHAGDKGSQLSGGQKQRVCIARTLMKHPAILLLDEATSALDSESELVVQRALDDLLAKSSRTTIIIAHRLSTIRNADMIVFVQSGRVVETGSHSELMAKPDGHYRKLVEANQGGTSAIKDSESNVADDRAGSMQMEDIHDDDLKTASEEHSISLADKAQDIIKHSSCTPMLQLRDVRFSYPNRPNNFVFKGLDLTIQQGETVALVGPSGQGKSTIVSLLERFYDPSAGSVEMLGYDLRDINVWYLRDQIGLVEQEPTLFAMSIAQNIAYGSPGTRQQDIITAAKAANAHGFISSFPDGYNTDVGERGSQLSGGQKQRIAIARAILKKPKIMLLDEATSALDNESQYVVQEALDKLAKSKCQTTLVIAHRLSTIRLADRVAFIAGGKVQEIGTFDELMAKPNGRFKRLFDLQNMRASQYLKTLKEKAHEYDKSENVEDDEEDMLDTKGEESIEKNDESTGRSTIQRTWDLAKKDLKYYLLGAFGATLTGLIFPAWGVMFAFTIQLLYQPVFPCDESNPDNGFASCQDYYDSVASDMRQMSFNLTYGWIGLIAVALVGNVILFYGLGAATEKLSKRVRDGTFSALVRQEVAYFDRRNVGDVVTQLQDDAGMLQAFTGEPIRVLVMNIASLVVSLVLAFVFMWPFALLFLAALPFMAIGSVLESRLEEESDEERIEEDEDSAGGIALESMAYVRTVAALTLEENRCERYNNALKKENKKHMKRNLLAGLAYGLGQLLQQWGAALIFWWGGWLLVTYPDSFVNEDFLISLSGLLLALNGLSIAAQDLNNRNEAKSAAARIFSLMDRKRPIDPLSDEGIVSL